MHGTRGAGGGRGFCVAAASLASKTTNVDWIGGLLEPGPQGGALGERPQRLSVAAASALPNLLPQSTPLLVDAPNPVVPGSMPDSCSSELCALCRHSKCLIVQSGLFRLLVLVEGLRHAACKMENKLLLLQWEVASTATRRPCRVPDPESRRF